MRPPSEPVPVVARAELARRPTATARVALPATATVPVAGMEPVLANSSMPVLIDVPPL